MEEYFLDDFSISRLIFPLLLIAMPIVTFLSSNIKNRKARKLYYSTSSLFVIIPTFVVSRLFILYAYYLHFYFTEWMIGRYGGINERLVHGLTFSFFESLYWLLISRIDYFKREPLFVKVVIANLVDGIYMTFLFMIVPVFALFVMDIIVGNYVFPF